MLNEFMFILIAVMILVFSILTVLTRKILRAAVYMLFVLISTAGLYFMLSYNFLAAVQLTVYAGGIVVLIIFSILLTSHLSERAVMAPFKQSLFSALATLAGATLTLVTILRYSFIPNTGVDPQFNITDVGNALVSYNREGYALPFEVVSILLLAAMIGSIVVAKKEPTLKNKEAELDK